MTSFCCLFAASTKGQVGLCCTQPKHFCSSFQIHNQFPCSFEFTEKFLVTLADHSYFSNFGTFLCDSEFERNLMGVKEHTVSLWSYINRPEILSNYLNCLYEPNPSVIWPSVAPVSLVRNSNFCLAKIIQLVNVWLLLIGFCRTFGKECIYDG